MIHVLEANVDDNGYGGVYALVKNIISVEQYPKTDICFSLCSFMPFEKQEHIQQFNDIGIPVYECWGESKNFVIKHIRTGIKLYKLLRKKTFDCVHLHSDTAYILFIYGLIAIVASNARILVHSHSGNVAGRYKPLKLLLQYICRPLLLLLPVTRLACSEIAANWMYCSPYNKKAIIIKNGIDTKKFQFNPNIRKIEREKLGITNENFLIGTVGRFSPQKNPEYLLRIFEEVHRIHPNSRLLWVGEGELKLKIVDEAKKCGIDDAIIFYGTSDHVERLYQAMDCFILPSRFEGLPVVGIEAQAAGLPCIISDRVTDKVKITNLVSFVSINSLEIWQQNIEKAMNIFRKDTKQEIVKAGYDMGYEIRKIEELYCQTVNME